MTFDLDLYLQGHSTLFWFGTQHDSIVWVIKRLRGVSSERRRSSCSSFCLLYIMFKKVSTNDKRCYICVFSVCFISCSRRSQPMTKDVTSVSFLSALYHVQEGLNQWQKMLHLLSHLPSATFTWTVHRLAYWKKVPAARAYEFKSSFKFPAVYKILIFQCTGKIFYVEFQWVATIHWNKRFETKKLYELLDF